MPEACSGACMRAVDYRSDSLHKAMPVGSLVLDTGILK
jgi:hypothetical protein